MMYSKITSYFRVHERLRLLWNACWDHTHDKTRNQLAAPKDVTGVTDMLQTAPTDGNIRLLCSPDKVASSHLYIHLVRLSPGRELLSRKAPGVEFYLCLAGKGDFSQRGVEGTRPLHKGEGVVVDAGNVRWFSNGKGKQDLLLLRATDATSSGDPVRMDPAARQTTFDILQTNYHQVKTLAQEYAQWSSSSSEN